MWAVNQEQLPIPEVEPKEPAFQVQAEGDNALATFGRVKGELHQQLARTPKKWAGLDPDIVGKRS